MDETTFRYYVLASWRRFATWQVSGLGGPTVDADSRRMKRWLVRLSESAPLRGISESASQRAVVFFLGRSDRNCGDGGFCFPGLDETAPQVEAFCWQSEHLIARDAEQAGWGVYV